MASTEQQIDDAVAKRHSQHTDTAFGVQSADLDMNLHKIIGLEDPTGDKDAAHKKYVDDHAGGGGGGDVVGPSSAIANAISLFDGVTGKLIKDSTRLIEDILTDDKHIPDGHAIKTYGDTHWTTGSGDVVGPASAINNTIPLFDGVTGKLIKDSTRLIEDALTDDKHIPDGHAIKVYGDANWGGYTNLTQFVDQTGWRLFYSDGDGDIIELVLGTSGQYLKANGIAAIPTWDIPAGAGDVVGPASNTDDYVPQWNGADSKTLKNGFIITVAGKALVDDASVAAQRTTLELLSAVLRDAEDVMTDGANLPDGHAIKEYGDANWMAGGGDVTGPSGANDSAIVLFDTTTGKLLKDSTRLIEDAMTDDKHIPDGHAIKEYGDANWGGGGGSPGGSNTHIQFNDSGSFGGDSSFRWIKATNILNFVDAEIQSLDTVPADFTLDASPLVGGWTWTYKGANVVKVKQSESLPNVPAPYGDPSHHFIVGQQICMYDGDLTNYEGSGMNHEMHALQVDMNGVCSSIQHKDMIGINVRAIGRIGWHMRGIAAITSDVLQLGEGIADNEFHIWNPSVGEGGHEQSKSLTGLQIVMHPHFGDESIDHLYRGLCIENWGKRLGYGIILYSATVSGIGDGHYKYAINLTPATVTAAAITMPQSATGQVGTIIQYDDNDYSYFDRSADTFIWMINNTGKAALSNTKFWVAGADIEIDTYLNAYKGRDASNNMIDLIGAVATKECAVGFQCNTVSLGTSSPYNDPVYIRVNGNNGQQLVRSPDTDSQGRHYITVP